MAGFLCYSYRLWGVGAFLLMVALLNWTWGWYILGVGWFPDRKQLITQRVLIAGIIFAAYLFVQYAVVTISCTIFRRTI